MTPAFRRFAFAVRRRLKAARDAVLGWIATGFLHAIRRIDRVRVTNAAGRFMRRLGPWLPEQRVGRANLVAAFPEKSATQIETILGGVWDNVGRVAAEFAHL